MEVSREGGELGFLGGCGAVSYPGNTTMKFEVKLNPLPSWVPNLRGLCYTCQFSKFTSVRDERVYNTDSASTAGISIRSLEFCVTGFGVCQIQSLSHVSTVWRDPTQEINWLDNIRAAGPYANDEIARAAFLRTLAADVLHVDWCAVSRGHSIDFSYEQRDHDCLTSEERVKKLQIREAVKQSTYCRRLLSTSNGHIGLAPLDAKIGDKICVFYGGQVLYVIRENKDKPSHTFVGECYVDGFMDGEASAMLRDGTSRGEVFILV
jgi:hypothetical protein